MDDTDIATMDAQARDDFLGNGGTGVLSFSTKGESPPHTVPVSYGYDAETETFYFRLSVSGDSEKAALLDRGVTFVTYGETDAGWRSVVAQGRLESTTEESIATESLQGLDNVHIPMYDVFDRSTRKVPFEFYRLAPDDLTGRTEPQPRN